MENKYLLIFIVLLSPVLTSVNSENNSSDDTAMQRFVNAVMAMTGKSLYLHLKQNPEQSHAIAALPMFCILGHLAFHAEGDEYERILQLMNLRNKNEIQKVLQTAVSYINNESDTSKLTFKVFGDESQRLTKNFKQDFINICNGESGSVNYNYPGQALQAVTNWFADQSSYPVIGTHNTDMFDKNGKTGIVYTTYMNFFVSYDNEANPNGLIDIEFILNENQTFKYPSLYGNGYFKHAKLEDLDAQVLVIRMKGEKDFVIFYWPNDPSQLFDLVRKLQDPEVYYGGIERAVWKCLKVHIAFGRCNLANRLFKYIPELQLNSINFNEVFASGKPAHVNYGFEQLHFIADKGVRKGQLNSKLCPGNKLPFLTINHPCAYYVMAENGMNIYAGVLYGPPGDAQ